MSMEHNLGFFSGVANGVKVPRRCSRPCAFEEQKNKKNKKNSRNAATKATAARRPGLMRDGVQRNRLRELARTHSLLLTLGLFVEISLVQVSHSAIYAAGRYYLTDIQTDEQT